ncbi:MAG: sugar phosphate isomerase/epimerase [Lachnospiraceae bacterium]|nr:sugar phosphate isomerase/epimerase [Lachnospiraceae bacterium]
MSISRIHVIPDADRIEETLEVCNEWNALFEYNDFFNPHLLDNKEELRKRISLYQRLNRKPFEDTLHGAFYDTYVDSQDPLIEKIARERMTLSMEIANELEVRGVVFHGNAISGFRLEGYISNWVMKNAEFYHELLNRFPRTNIWVENTFDTTPEALLRLLKEMSGEERFGICFDVAHANIQSIPMNKWIEAFGKHIKHIHINDNDGISDLHNSVGSGTVNWRDFFEQINRIDNDMSMLIEVKSIESQIESLNYLKVNKYI